MDEALLENVRLQNAYLKQKIRALTLKNSLTEHHLKTVEKKDPLARKDETKQPATSTKKNIWAFNNDDYSNF